MAETFTATWQAVFGWLMQLFTMPLPYFFGAQQLNMIDIVVGTLGIFLAIATIRALLGQGFTIAGAALTNLPTEADRMTKRVDSLGEPEQLAALPAPKPTRRSRK